MIGVAQEKVFSWRGCRDGGSDAHPHFDFKRQTVFVNHLYFYILGPDWGPSFLKTVAYAPYGVWTAGRCARRLLDGPHALIRHQRLSLGTSRISLCFPNETTPGRRCR